MRPTIHQLRTMVEVFNNAKSFVERTNAKEMRRRNLDRESAAIQLAEDVLRVVRGEKNNFDYDLATSYSATVAELNACVVSQDQQILNRFERQFCDRTNKMVEVR